MGKTGRGKGGVFSDKSTIGSRLGEASTTCELIHNVENLRSSLS